MLTALVAVGMIGIQWAHAGDNAPAQVVRNSKSTADLAGEMSKANLENARRNRATTSPASNTGQAVQVANPQVGQIIEQGGKQYMLQEQNGQLVAVPFSIPAQAPAPSSNIPIATNTGPAMTDLAAVDNQVQTAQAASEVNQIALRDNSAGRWAGVDQTASTMAHGEVVTGSLANSAYNVAGMANGLLDSKFAFKGLFGGKGAENRALAARGDAPLSWLQTNGQRPVAYARPAVAVQRTTTVIHVCRSCSRLGRTSCTHRH